MVEQTDETAPRKLSVPERAERHNKIAKRLPGLDIRNRHEPSDSLVDTFVAQYEQNRIQFVERDRLTSKEQEASSNAKKETVLSVDSSGRLKTEKGDSAKAETSTELLLQFALTRRGVAMEMGNLLDFSLHARWVERLLSARLDSVPATHLQPTFNQLQLADRKLFQLLAEKTRSGIQATPSGRPVDEVFESTWMAPEVLHTFFNRCRGQPVRPLTHQRRAALGLTPPCLLIIGCPRGRAKARARRSSVLQSGFQLGWRGVDRIHMQESPYVLGMA